MDNFSGTSSMPSRCFTFSFLIFVIFLSFSFLGFNNPILLNAQASSGSDCSSKDSNIIVGTRPFTLGTKCNDVIIACPVHRRVHQVWVQHVGNGDIVRGFEKNDVIQGSVGNDELYGDEGNDKILGSQGSDKIYGGPDTDIIQAGEGADLLVGGNGDDELYGGTGDDVSIGGKGVNFFDCGDGSDIHGDDELYGGAGDDVSIGGKGVNFFDCGDGNDIIVDFDPSKGDTQSGNCEVVLNNHGDMNIFTQPNKIKSQLEAFGIGSSKDQIDINNLGKTIDN